MSREYKTLKAILLFRYWRGKDLIFGSKRLEAHARGGLFTASYDAIRCELPEFLNVEQLEVLRNSIALFCEPFFEELVDHGVLNKTNVGRHGNYVFLNSEAYNFYRWRTLRKNEYLLDHSISLERGIGDEFVWNAVEDYPNAVCQRKGFPYWAGVVAFRVRFVLRAIEFRIFREIETTYYPNDMINFFVVNSAARAVTTGVGTDAECDSDSESKSNTVPKDEKIEDTKASEHGLNWAMIGAFVALFIGLITILIMKGWL